MSPISFSNASRGPLLSFSSHIPTKAYFSNKRWRWLNSPGCFLYRECLKAQNGRRLWKFTTLPKQLYDALGSGIGGAGSCGPQNGNLFPMRLYCSCYFQLLIRLSVVTFSWRFLHLTMRIFRRCQIKSNPTDIRVCALYAMMPLRHLSPPGPMLLWLNPALSGKKGIQNTPSWRNYSPEIT